MPSLWLRWTMANAAPLLVVMLFVALLSGALATDVLAVAAHALVLVTVAGAQALVLRRRVAAGRWAALTAGGWLVGASAGVVTMATLDAFGEETLGVCLGMTVVGAVLGGAQWLALRGRVAGAGRWVAASAASWLAVGALSLTVFHAAHGAPPAAWTRSPLATIYEGGHAELQLLATGLVAYGVMTGALLGILLGRAGGGRRPAMLGTE